MSDLKELLERVKKATGPDREIDGAIHNAVFGTEYIRSSGSVTGFMTSKIDNGNPMVSNYTASLDAIVALIEAKLPGWTTQLFKNEKGWKARLRSPRYDLFCTNVVKGEEHRVPTGPLSLCAAFLSALTKENAHGK